MNETKLIQIGNVTPNLHKNLEKHTTFPRKHITFSVIKMLYLCNLTKDINNNLLDVIVQGV